MRTIIQNGAINLCMLSLNLLFLACGSAKALKTHETQKFFSLKNHSYSQSNAQSLKQLAMNDPAAACANGEEKETINDLLTQDFEKNPKLLNLLGLCHFRLGQHEKALFFLRKALGIIGNKNDLPKPLAQEKAMALNNLGLIYLANSNVIESVELFQASIKAHENPVAHLNLAALAVEYAHFEEALTHLATLDPRDETVMVFRLRALAGQERHKEVVELFAKLPKVLQSREDVALSSAFSLYKLHRYQEAILTLKERRPLAFNLDSERADKLLSQIEQEWDKIEAQSEKKESVGAKSREVASENITNEIKIIRGKK